MYANRIQNFLNSLAALAKVNADEVPLANESLRTYLGALALATDGSSTPPGDATQLTVRLTLLTRGLALAQNSPALEGAHYLAAMGYEHTAIAFRSTGEKPDDDPIKNEDWFRRFIACLHYLAGGYRVQGWATSRELHLYAADNDTYNAGFRIISDALAGASSERSQRGLAQLTQGYPFQAELISNLLLAISNRTGFYLSHLGEAAPAAWGLRHNLDAVGLRFWSNYLRRLRTRGITSFTSEQGRFDEWLNRTNDALIILPTGAGKSVVGELMTALHLAGSGAVVWLLPTRALVRQVKRDLRQAFAEDADVEELPSSEDAVPLFATPTSQREVAVTTPERLAALIRARPEALASVSLVVMDEAHLLLDRSRGVTAEETLRRLQDAVPDCRLVLMTGLADAAPTLEQVFAGLERTPRTIVSDARPTRRIYGVLTERQTADNRSSISILVHGAKTSADFQDAPLLVDFPARSRRPSSSKTEIASRFAPTIAATDARTVFFVQQKRSAESQARKLARRLERSHEISFSPPEGALARIRLELGRMSQLEATAPWGVAAHHGSLTPLEQHFVEKWVNDGHVRTVFATPTLAQGINLPFHIAVVTFLQRYNSSTGNSEPLTAAEVMNMLGRAGRAGKVADGLCLLALESTEADPKQTLERTRRIFFASQVSEGSVGLGRLLVSAAPFMSIPGWANSLEGVSFSDARSLLTLVAGFANQGLTTLDALASTLPRYPSIAALGDAAIHYVADAMSRAVLDFTASTSGDDILGHLVARTGLPPRYCRAIKALVIKTSALPDSAVDWRSFGDEAVFDAIAEFDLEPWLVELTAGFKLSDFPEIVATWRSGGPVAEVEKLIQTLYEDYNERDVGEMLNHKITASAQLWAAIPLAAEILGNSQMVEGTRTLPSLVREGVDSIEGLAWLRALGGLDRVLAQSLGSTISLPELSRGGRIRAARQQIIAWRSGRQAPPAEHRIALLDLIG